MVSMPRPRPPFLRRETTRHGKTVWYVRRRDGKRARIRAPFGTPEFDAEYLAAVEGRASVRQPAKPARESLAWLIARYRESSAWSRLSLATKRQRENILKPVLESAGSAPFARITRKTIVEGRERRARTPAQANNFLKAMRGLFKWAADAEFMADDPTRGVAVIKTRSEGFHAWTEEEVGAFEKRWPLGTRERLAFDVLLYTGLRRGDAVKLGRQHVRVIDGEQFFQIRTEKTGIAVVAPILPALQRSIEAAQGATGALAFIAGKRGAPMVKESFGTWFKGACKAAGVPGSAHGLRKAGAARAAEDGATEAQLNALFGWTGSKMAAHYTRSASRARLARAARANQKD
jgi:integrase